MNKERESNNIYGKMFAKRFSFINSIFRKFQLLDQFLSFPNLVYLRQAAPEALAPPGRKNPVVVKNYFSTIKNSLYEYVFHFDVSFNTLYQGMQHKVLEASMPRESLKDQGAFDKLLISHVDRVKKLGDNFFKPFSEIEELSPVSSSDEESRVKELLYKKAVVEQEKSRRKASGVRATEKKISGSTDIPGDRHSAVQDRAGKDFQRTAVPEDRSDSVREAVIPEGQSDLARETSGAEESSSPVRGTMVPENREDLILKTVVPEDRSDSVRDAVIPEGQSDPARETSGAEESSSPVRGTMVPENREDLILKTVVPKDRSDSVREAVIPEGQSDPARETSGVEESSSPVRGTVVPENREDLILKTAGSGSSNIPAEGTAERERTSQQLSSVPPDNASGQTSFPGAETSGKENDSFKLIFPSPALQKAEDKMPEDFSGSSHAEGKTAAVQPDEPGMIFHQSESGENSSGKREVVTLALTPADILSSVEGWRPKGIALKVLSSGEKPSIIERKAVALIKPPGKKNLPGDLSLFFPGDGEEYVVASGEPDGQMLERKAGEELKVHELISLETAAGEGRDVILAYNEQRSGIINEAPIRISHITQNVTKNQEVPGRSVDGEKISPAVIKTIENLNIKEVTRSVLHSPDLDRKVEKVLFKNLPRISDRVYDDINEKINIELSRRGLS